MRASVVMQAVGQPRPHETSIGIDFCFTTAILPVPDDVPADWKIVLTHPNASQPSRRAVVWLTTERVLSSF
jgi:hypothetical protein